MLCLSSLPVIKPKLEITFQSERDWGVLDLVVKPLEWINQTIDSIKGFFTKNNISHEGNLETLLKEIEVWKTYLASLGRFHLLRRLAARSLASAPAGTRRMRE